jgi:hypothetical protein
LSGAVVLHSCGNDAGDVRILFNAEAAEAGELLFITAS